MFVKEAYSGGERAVKWPVEGELPGAGSCGNCSTSFSRVQWPGDAYFTANVRGGTVWAWNMEYLVPLRAQVAGDKTLKRQLILKNVYFSYFLSRTPKFVVVKRNRENLLRYIDAWLKASVNRPCR